MKLNSKKTQLNIKKLRNKRSSKNNNKEILMKSNRMMFKNRCKD